jgi:hypothetical protein
MSEIENLNEAEIGSYLKCATDWNETVEGFLYGYDSNQEFFILENEPLVMDFPAAYNVVYKLPKSGEHSLRILNRKNVKNIQILKKANEMSTKDKLRFDKESIYIDGSYDKNAIKSRCEENIARITSNLSLVGVGIDDEAQTLFNRLYNMFI